MAELNAIIAIGEEFEWKRYDVLHCAISIEREWQNAVPLPTFLFFLLLRDEYITLKEIKYRDAIYVITPKGREALNSGKGS
ncbi:hypothetical protein KAR91_53775 [Candidatus Pacearchaeota archaeon]|nr:hypothetical protein [Candidatus Pacearchaeota archaeon]